MRPFNEHTVVPVHKDSENEGPIPSAWRPTLKNIVDAFVRHDYLLAVGVAGVAPVSEEAATQIRTYIQEDGAKLVSAFRRELLRRSGAPGGDGQRSDRIVALEFTPALAKSYWFFIINQVPDLPEALIAGREDPRLRQLFSDWCYNPLAIDGADFETYVEACRRPGAVHGTFAVPQAYHLPQEEQPEIVNLQSLDFLRNWKG